MAQILHMVEQEFVEQLKLSAIYILKLTSKNDGSYVRY